MDGKVINLSTPIELFGRRIVEVTMREPKGGLFARLGQPRVAVFNQSAQSGYYVEQNEVVANYLEALVDSEDAKLLLSQLSLSDAIRVREALFGFFEEAAAKVASQR